MRYRIFRLWLGVFCSVLLELPASSHQRWTELNIGPFYVDTDEDVSAARNTLTQLEQLRWVLGNLLESQNLLSVWPIRVLISDEGTERDRFSGEFVWQNGQFVLVSPRNAHVPLFQVAGILLDANTPRLPEDVESGLRQLFDTLEAHGSRVTWGGAPPHPDLAWARMQLFATKFEYTAGFHIFLAALKDESGIAVAERNAFGKDSKSIDQEAAAVLASRDWQPVPVSGRPLDPKRDFGEHSLNGAVAAVYLADAEVAHDRKHAEAAYKTAIEAGGAAAALGYEGLATIAKLENEDPRPFLNDAIQRGSKSAPVYVAAAEGLAPEKALPLLKTAARLNPVWAEPIYRQAQLAADPTEREALLKKATQLNPREPQYWIALAKVQTGEGHATAAQGSWLEAENAGTTPVEREHIHHMRLESEQERLDAADAARRREREAVHVADQQAQDAEAARIRLAEQKANQALDQAGSGAPAAVVPWQDTVPKRKLEGMLIRVDCLNGPDRLWVRDRSGQTVELFLKDPGDLTGTCGPQQPARRVSVNYAAQPDERFHTAGTVVSILVR